MLVGVSMSCAYPAELFTAYSAFGKQQEVCEGQQHDMDFPQQDNVSKAEYLHMIENKTAVLWVVLYKWVQW